MHAHLAAAVIVLFGGACGDGVNPGPPTVVIDQAPAALSSTTHVTVTFHADDGDSGTTFACHFNEAPGTPCVSKRRFIPTNSLLPTARM